VVVPHNYNGSIPNEYELIDLPACQLLVFQELLSEQECFTREAEINLQNFIKNFFPEQFGLCWANNGVLAGFQLGLHNRTGYIEGRTVEPTRELSKASSLLGEGIIIKHKL